MPTVCQRAGFGFTVADHAGDEQVRIIKCSTIGVGRAVTQLATLMDRSRNLRRDVTGDPVRPGKLPKKTNRPRRGPPVTQQPRFQVRQGERLLKQRLASILDAAIQDFSLRFDAERRQVMRNGLGVRIGQ
jgi:hypothetical protein